MPIARTREGSCVFLESGGCRIHREHGAETKPAACRRFPYFVRDAGGERWLHLSRMCPTVYDEQGARGDQLARDARNSGAEPDTLRGSEPVAFSGSTMLAWDEYLRFEEKLCALLEDERWPLDDAVAGGLLLLEQAANREEQGADDTMELVLAAIAKRRPMVGLYRYIMAGVVTMIESERGEKLTFAARRANMARFLRLLLRSGTIRLAAIGADVDAKSISAIRWPRKEHPRLTPVRHLLTSHIRHKILLRAPDVEFAYYLLIAAYAAIKFYARAAAAARDRETLHSDDLRRGVEVAELHLLLHRRGGTIERDLGRGFFRKFLFHPSFPSSMVAF